MYKRQVFVCPKGGFAAGHPADAGDTVDDGVIVPLAGFHLEDVYKRQEVDRGVVLVLLRPVKLIFSAVFSASA